MKTVLNNLVRVALNHTVIPAARHVLDALPASTVIRELEVRSARDSADYAEARMQHALHFSKKQELWDHALSRRPAGGLLAEFGVWKGKSTRYLALKVEPEILHGFDSFKGLGEDWRGWELPKGSFDRGGRPPRVPSNVRFSVGVFSQTLPPFLEAQAAAFSFVHIDCDTYEASKSVLDLIAGRLLAGAVVVFDEYFGYRGWRLGEFKAFHECVCERSLAYEYLAFSNQSVSVRIAGP